MKEVNLSQAEEQLRTGSIGMLFRKFAIPGVISLLFLGLQTIIDGIVIGNFVGANALASVSLILPIYSLISSVCIVFGIGCETLVGIRLGEQDKRGANSAAKSAFLALTGFAVAASIIIFIFAPELTAILGGNDVLMSDSVDYVRYMMPFYPLLAIMFFNDHMLKAVGNPMFATTVMSITVILNIILDLLFVAVFDMGTAGAGLATGMAFATGAVMSSPKVFGRKNIVRVFRGRFRWRLVGMMAYNGSSEGLTELSVGLSIMLFNLMLMKYAGETGVAAFTAINYILFVGITIILGVSGGIIPIISYNFGADQWERIKKTLNIAIITNFIVGAAIFTILVIFREPIVGLFFKSNETEVIKLAAEGTVIVAFALLVNGFNILASSYFTAIANAKLSIVISVMRAIGFVAVGIFLFTWLWGLEGIWYAIPVAELCTLAISIPLVIWSFKKGRKMKDIANI